MTNLDKRVLVLLSAFCAFSVGAIRFGVADTEERARAWCGSRCEVVRCYINSTCDIRYPGRPAYAMDCRGKACSWP